VAICKGCPGNLFRVMGNLWLVRGVTVSIIV
jgi:hypothetical protein